MSSILSIGLVGCGKAKADKPTEASALYTGNLFKAALKYARFTNDHVFILSALHEIVRLDQVVGPYDRTMPIAMSEREAWAGRVMSRLQSWVTSTARSKHDVIVTILAGANYCDTLAGYLTHRAGYTVFTPLKGMGIGERLKWFKDQELRRHSPEPVIPRAGQCPWCGLSGYVPGERHRCGFADRSPKGNSKEKSDEQVRSRRR
jgi:hypothetical protein